MKMRRALLRRLRLRESWVIFFILGLVMMNYPFIQIFNTTDRIFAIPLLYFYFVGGWALSIGVIYLFTRAIDQPEDGQDEGDHH